MPRALRTAALAAAALLLLTFGLDRALPPTAPPPLALGDRLISGAEGMSHEVLEVVDGGPRLRTRLEPGAAGPPLHLHLGFDETFVVKEGELILRMGEEDRRVGPGGRVTVPAGTPHAPRNPGARPVIIEHDPGMPSMSADFGAHLPGLYRAMDAAGAADHPLVLLHLAAQPEPVDTWLVGPPLPAQRALRALLRPLGRILDPAR
ncbi:MAG: cupin domain-containing protein [Deltaproteobacteria bacterium]|nr:cupin domain-containing protein [Deltaproteobacteria bacterium]